MIALLMRRMFNIKPYSGPRFTCTQCGRMTIHSGSCYFCGGKVA